jgi:hypothetical protein
MNNALNQWFASRTPEPGLFGFGVRMPDGTCASQSFHDAYPRENFDETLLGLAETLPVFSQHGLSPRWLTWTYEHGQLRVAMRSDGVLIALAIQPNSRAAGTLDALTEEFLALDLTA